MCFLNRYPQTILVPLFNRNSCFLRSQSNHSLQPATFSRNMTRWLHFTNHSFIHDPSSLWYQPNCIYFSTQLTRFLAKKCQQNFALMGLWTSTIFLLLSVTIVIGKNLPVSAVSAAPTLLPGSGYQLSSPATAGQPALSPDISTSAFTWWLWPFSERILAAHHSF